MARKKQETAEEEAIRLMAKGYRRTSNKHCILSRVDRWDWQMVIKDRSNPLILLCNGHAADHYRRVFSEDKITVSHEVARRVSTSDHDPLGFVDENGKEVPSAVVTLTYPD